MDEKTAQQLINAPLGEKTAYISEYSPQLLFPIARQIKRDEINVPKPLPFYGMDVWHGFELSWLNTKGKPCVALARFQFDCNTTNIIESKSFKLYLNSFNNSRFDGFAEVQVLLHQDLQAAADGIVQVELLPLQQIEGQMIEGLKGQSLDELDISCDTYSVEPSYLTADPNVITEESLTSDLLKSNCLVTGQPDWGSLKISYYGPKIDQAGLLRYIVSFRNHNEFHEQCVERIFMDLLTYCRPERLSVEARYTRRGGLDINPIRSTEQGVQAGHIRLVRQ